MPRILRKLAVGALCIGLLACWVLYAVYPEFPSSAAGWIAVFLVGVPLAACLEQLGTWAMDRPFLKRWWAPARILYGLCAMLLLIAVAAPALWFMQRLIAA